MYVLEQFGRKISKLLKLKTETDRRPRGHAYVDDLSSLSEFLFVNEFISCQHSADVVAVNLVG